MKSQKNSYFLHLFHCQLKNFHNNLASCLKFSFCKALVMYEMMTSSSRCKSCFLIASYKNKILLDLHMGKEEVEDFSLLHEIHIDQLIVSHYTLVWPQLANLWTNHWSQTIKLTRKETRKDKRGITSSCCLGHHKKPVIISDVIRHLMTLQQSCNLQITWIVFAFNRDCKAVIDNIIRE